MSTDHTRFEQAPVTNLKGVGPAMADKLAKLGITLVKDLLFHLPSRYLDQTQITPIGDLQPNQYAVLEATIQNTAIQFGRRRSLACAIEDDSGTCTLRFYHFTAAQKQRLEPGTQVRVLGEARRGANGLEFYHPEVKTLATPIAMPDHLTPIYPTVEGISQLKWLQMTEQLVDQLRVEPITELLPGLAGQPSLSETLIFLHRPPSDASADKLCDRSHPKQQRLAMEELLAHHLSLKKLKRSQQAAAYPLPAAPKLAQALQKALPFAPTGAQTRVIDEVCADIAKPITMRRLVQGDVGSGKTLVAAFALLPAIAAGKQAALMAPTEILAEQHLANLSRWLAPLGIEVGLLVGKQTAKQKRELTEQLASGAIQVVVGTQALFQDSVEFADLALTVIDEQHRFGVSQRLALQQKNKRASPHMLLLTAPPIPRTLAMSFYANLDVSIIDELPPGRTPIATSTISSNRRQEVVQRVGAACEDGRQAYWVCTLIDESETLQAQAAEQTAQALASELPELRVGLIHGRQSPQEKETQMQAFKSGEVDLLVATTVIEVGVDVPNASVMVIENPERLGLSQLHQLRGRVGRGSTASHCLLLYQKPLGKVARRRLEVMKSTTDGFVIAEEDLRLRGPGELLGTRQTGDLQFRIADLNQHHSLLGAVIEAAEQIEIQQPELIQPLIDRWLKGREAWASV